MTASVSSARRSASAAVKASLDYPVIDTNCTRRVTSATPLQSLAMLNGEFVAEKASDLQKRVFKDTG